MEIKRRELRRAKPCFWVRARSERSAKAWRQNGKAIAGGNHRHVQRERLKTASSFLPLKKSPKGLFFVNLFASDIVPSYTGTFTFAVIKGMRVFVPNFIIFILTKTKPNWLCFITKTFCYESRICINMLSAFCLNIGFLFFISTNFYFFTIDLFYFTLFI